MRAGHAAAASASCLATRQAGSTITGIFTAGRVSEGRSTPDESVSCQARGSKTQVRDAQLFQACTRVPYPVLGRGPYKALGRVLILDTCGVPTQNAVYVAELDQQVAVIALQACIVRSAHYNSTALLDLQLQTGRQSW